MTENANLIKKSNNCVDEYCDSFGYSSFGDEKLGFTSSFSFFKYVTEWPADGSNATVSVKYNIATIRMTEAMALELATFIFQQHEDRNKK
ncbi:TPA: hypothetical protein OTZ41_001004 [Raoultella ornithinolytica]|nr:hypothetical protein [Raoultella ornithinolytica]